ncbi:MAG: hypothetical protein ACXW2U_00285 [Telluria sp.]
MIANNEGQAPSIAVALSVHPQQAHVVVRTVNTRAVKKAVPQGGMFDCPDSKGSPGSLDTAVQKGRDAYRPHRTRVRGE